MPRPLRNAPGAASPGPDVDVNGADARFMARAVTLARRGWYSTRPNPRVGCVLVRNGRVIGEGWHARAGGPHAEVAALAAARAAGEDPAGASAFVTLEPCSHHGRTPPCAEALIAAGIARVVYGHEDPNPRVSGRGLALLHKAGVVTAGPVLERDARALNRGFLLRAACGRPYVRAKLAMTLDARIALADGRSQWITGTAARADGQRLRAGAGAVLTGAGTVAADDPALTVRDPRFVAALPGQPLRVVMDRTLRAFHGKRRIADCSVAPTLIFAEPGAAVQGAPLSGAGTELCTDVPVTPAAVLRVLAEREINDVLVEAGPQLTGAFLRADLIDELIVYLAPKLLGGAAIGGFDMPSPAALADCRGFELAETRRIGADLRLTLLPRKDRGEAAQP